MAKLSIDHNIPAPGRELCGIAWDGARLWHADAGTNLLYCLDVEDGRIMRTLECPEIRTCTSFAEGLLWQVAGRPKELRALNPGTGAIVSRIPLVSETVCGVEGRVWYTVDDPGLIVRVDPDTGKEVGRYDFAGTPTGLGWDGGRLWCADHAAKELLALRVG
jgi:outer membrane protein assembly factor BamB